MIDIFQFEVFSSNWTDYAEAMIHELLSNETVGAVGGWAKDMGSNYFTRFVNS